MQRDELDRFDPVMDSRPNDQPWPEMLWPIPAGTQLLGATVQLVPLDPTADAADLFRAFDHDKVWAHVPGRPQNPLQFREELIARCAQSDCHPWVVRTQCRIADVPAGRVVGTSSTFRACDELS
jgi:hypothetical protein